MPHFADRCTINYIFWNKSDYQGWRHFAKLFTLLILIGLQQWFEGCRDIRHILLFGVQAVVEDEVFHGFEKQTLSREQLLQMSVIPCLFILILFELNNKQITSDFIIAKTTKTAGVRTTTIREVIMDCGTVPEQC